jgi:hypothetical protein
MKIKCPKCESFDIHITEYPNPHDNIAVCYACGYAGMSNDFPKMTIFDHITESEKALAEKMAYIVRCEEDPTLMGWTSAIIQSLFATKAEAIAATVAKLKEVCDAESH